MQRLLVQLVLRLAGLNFLHRWWQELGEWEVQDWGGWALNLVQLVRKLARFYTPQPPALASSGLAPAATSNLFFWRRLILKSHIEAVKTRFHEAEFPTFGVHTTHRRLRGR